MHYVMMYMYVEHYKDAPEQIVIQNEEPIIAPYKGKEYYVPQTDEQLMEMCPYVPLKKSYSIIPETYPAYDTTEWADIDSTNYQGHWANNEDQSFFKDSRTLLSNIEVKPREGQEEAELINKVMDVLDNPSSHFNLNEFINSGKHMPRIKKIIDEYNDWSGFLWEKLPFCSVIHTIIMDSGKEQEALNYLAEFIKNNHSDINDVSRDLRNPTYRDLFLTLFEEGVKKL